MEYRKNKAKVLLFYLVFYIVTSALIYTVSYFLGGDLGLQVLIVSEGLLLLSPIMFKNALFSEINQSVMLVDDKIECKNFYISGNLADCSFDFSQIASVEIKNSLFSRCMVIRVNGDKKHPVVLNNQFENYSELWAKIIDNCKKQNPDAIKIKTK